MAALRNKKLNLKKKRWCNVLIIRVNNKGDLLGSKPCVNCTKILNKLPIKRIYFSNNDGEIECVSKAQFISTHTSDGYKIKY